jgi:hypothetical protein
MSPMRGNSMVGEQFDSPPHVKDFSINPNKTEAFDYNSPKARNSDQSTAFGNTRQGNSPSRSRHSRMNSMH